jgi:hypothetical protein
MSIGHWVLIQVEAEMAKLQVEADALEPIEEPATDAYLAGIRAAYEAIRSVRVTQTIAGEPITLPPRDHQLYIQAIADLIDES